MHTDAHRPVKRARTIVQLLLLGFIALWLVSLLFPLDPWARIPPESVTISEPGHQFSNTAYYDWGGGAACSPSQQIAFDSMTEGRTVGVGMNCVLPARSPWGIVHDLSAGLLLPVLSLTVFLTLWARNRVKPWWKPINVAVGIISVVFLIIGYRTTGNIMFVPVEGVPVEQRPPLDYFQQLQRSLFVTGVGGIISVIVTQVSESLIDRLNTTIRLESTSTLAERAAQRERSRSGEPPQ